MTDSDDTSRSSRDIKSSKDMFTNAKRNEVKYYPPHLRRKSPILTAPLGMSEETTQISTGHKFTKLFGCNFCSWYATEMCPHRIGYADNVRERGGMNRDGKRYKKGDVITSHSNGMCSDRRDYIMMLVPDINLTHYTKIAQIVNFADDNAMLQEQLRLYRSGKRTHEDVLKWSKQVSESARHIRKQDEGVKVQHMNPLDKMREIIDVNTSEELEELERMYETEIESKQSGDIIGVNTSEELKELEDMEE